MSERVQVRVRADFGYVRQGRRTLKPGDVITVGAQEADDLIDIGAVEKVATRRERLRSWRKR